MTNLEAAVAFINAEISVGKFLEIVSERYDVAEVLRGVTQAAMAENQKNHIAFCCRCRKLVFRRRAAKTPCYCEDPDCKAVQKKLAKLRNERPVSLDSIPSNFSHSTAREINSYNGGYSE